VTTRWHGFSELVQDAVHHGTVAVEKVHQQVARAPFDVLALVPRLATGARWVADRQASAIAATYGTIRAVNAGVGEVVRLGLDVAERRRESDAGERAGK
jgi:hypothetical protein